MSTITRKELEELRTAKARLDALEKKPTSETQEQKIQRLEFVIAEERIKGREALTEAGAQKEVNIDNRYQLDAYQEHLPDFMRIKSEWIDYMVQWTGSLFAAHKELHRTPATYLIYAIIAIVAVFGLYTYNSNPADQMAVSNWANSGAGQVEVIGGLGLGVVLVYWYFFRRK